ncbi:MAG: uridine kinase [Pseudonocardiaceae bacterium]
MGERGLMGKQDGTHVHLSVSTWQQPLPRPASPERSALVDSIAQRILTLGPGRLRVGIDGRTAAGKTSFGHELAEQISRSGRPVLRATLDDFKKPWRDRHLYDRESGEGYYRNAFDYAALVELLLKRFGAHGATDCALCSIDPLTQLDHSSVLTPAPPDAVLIVDGVYAFRPEINHFWDFRIWLEVDAETSVRRGAQRDQDWAGSESEALHRDRYLPAEQLYIQEVGPLRLADIVIDNSALDAPDIVRG